MNNDQRAIIAAELQQFLEEELDVSIGTFESADLADFVVEKIGPWLYNQGVLDARTKLGHVIEGMAEELMLLEKPSPLDR